MSKDYINLYRKKTQSLKCDNSQKNKLVDGAYGSTQVFHIRRHRESTVNLIIDNAKEGLGTAIVYSWPKDHLHIGDYFRWKDQIFLVTNLEHNVFLDDNIYKFNARVCNCEINYNYSPSLIAPTYNTIPSVFIGRTTQKLSGTINKRGDIPPLYITNDVDVIIFSAAKIDKFESVLIREEQ